MPLDKIDAEILRLLEEDSLRSFVEIAEKIGVTDGTIHQRIRKLKNRGVIERFTIKLNYKRIGANSLAYLFMNVDPGFINSVSAEVSKIPDIMEVHEIHAHGDLLIKIRASSQEEIRNIIVDKIRKIEGVVNIDLFLVYKIWKEESNIPIHQNLTARA